MLKEYYFYVNSLQVKVVNGAGIIVSGEKLEWGLCPLPMSLYFSLYSSSPNPTQLICVLGWPQTM